MTKDEIRHQIAASRPDFQTLEKRSAVIVEKFRLLELFQQAKTLGAYMPLPDEVNITPLLDFGSAGGIALPEHSKSKGGASSISEPPTPCKKTFYIPAFNEASGGYQLAELTPELKSGKFSIPEPANPVFAPEKFDLIIVPGIAFDRAGNRLGRGGGFYDRLLPQYHATRVGVCFDFQCLPLLSDEGVEVEKIPVEPHDCNVDLLVTES